MIATFWSVSATKLSKWMRENFIPIKGNYSYFLEKRAARIENFETETAKAKQLYKKELDWMSRQPKARTTKSKSRIDDFTEIKNRAHQRRKDHVMELELNMERMGTKVVELHGHLKIL